VAGGVAGEVSEGGRGGGVPGGGMYPSVYPHGQGLVCATWVHRLRHPPPLHTVLREAYPHACTRLARLNYDATQGCDCRQPRGKFFPSPSTSAPPRNFPATCVNSMSSCRLNMLFTRGWASAQALAGILTMIIHTAFSRDPSRRDIRPSSSGSLSATSQGLIEAPAQK